MSAATSTPRTLTLNTGLGMVVTISVSCEGNEGASGVVVVSGENATFVGTARWTTAYTTAGLICEIPRGPFTSTQRHALGELIKNALTIHLINF